MVAAEWGLTTDEHERGPGHPARLPRSPFAPRLAEAGWFWLPVKLPGVIKYVFGLGKV
jgi:hypothetical protein